MLKQTAAQVNILYNNILLLSRNKLFYTKFDLADNFQNRIILIFIHISFLFTKINKNKKKQIYKDSHQKLFDLTFSKIDENLRELGYGDTVVNKNMKFLVKSFYNILLICRDYRKKTINSKKLFFSNYLKSNNIKNTLINASIIDYFDKYEAFCFDLSSDSVLQGELNFKYK